jgi:predicted O-linked N-acetylglucosamine transferase (SPINDLY family)
MDNTSITDMLAEADLFFDKKAYQQALAEYGEVFSVDPDNVEARTGIALSLVHMGRYAEAVPRLHELQGFLPNSEQLTVILAEALSMSGCQEEAEKCLEEVVANSPRNIDAQVNLGRIYLDRGKHREANRCLSKALELDPNNVEALSRMGVMMIHFCQYNNALQVLHKALAIEPKNILVLNNLGRACKMLGHLEDALQWFETALEIDPDNVCVIDNYLFALNYCSGLEPDYVAREHFRLAPLCTPKNQIVPVVFQKRLFGDNLRVGYVSGDLYAHSVSYFIEPVLQHHNYQKFDVYCYSLGSTRDETTDRLMALPCQWRNFNGLQPEALAQRITEDRIDILVDLSGHTAENRLGAFALRSAPVQVSWLGYPNTSGLAQMDYYITDDVCDPCGVSEKLYTEKLYRLPKVFSCYLPPMAFPAVSSPPFQKNDYITFGSFNNFAKVNEKLMEVWAVILSRVPNSRLYLKSMALGDQETKREVEKTFASHGIAAERILMRTVTMTPLEHMEEYAEVDIALDTYPYNGTTTTCEALWNGVPVVTRAGMSHISRVGLSFLESLNLPALVAHSDDEYIDIAVRTACGRGVLRKLRSELRGVMAASPLMDAEGLTKSLEKGYEEMAQERGVF